jgi:hypothetical protein
VFCTRPPASVLFKPDRPFAADFDQLSTSVMPIFPIERSISVKGLSVRRKQIPICPAFCLTDYKVQGSTLPAAILDLKNDPARRGQDSHRKYCSLYVQLSRLRSFQGLYLLQNITTDDLRFSPDPDLLVEMERLRDLQARTLAAWSLSG